MRIGVLRAVLEELAEISRDGDIGPGDFQEVMLRSGLMLEIPADAEFQDEHGVDTMLVVWVGPEAAWGRARSTARRCAP